MKNIIYTIAVIDIYKYIHWGFHIYVLDITLILKQITSNQ